MAANLKVRKDQIGNLVLFDYAGASRCVYLDENTPQEQLLLVQFVGIDVFEQSGPGLGPKKDK